MGEMIQAGDAQPWVERHGDGPDVLLIAGLGDPAEGWRLQLDGLADRYRLIAFDNRGRARPLPDGPLSLPRWPTMPGRSAGAGGARGPTSWLLDGQRHRAGAGASAFPARPQPRPGEHVRSPDALFRSQLDFWRWLRRRRRVSAPSSRVLHVALYAARARDGSVDQLVEEALAFPHQQSVEAFQAQVDVCSPTTRGPPLGDRRADARPVRRARHHPAAALRCRRRGDPERALRGRAGRGTSPSRRSRTSSTPGSMPSGAKSRAADHRGWSRGRFAESSPSPTSSPTPSWLPGRRVGAGCPHARGPATRGPPSRP